jgi:hypothetical protein
MAQHSREKNISTLLNEAGIYGLQSDEAKCLIQDYFCDSHSGSDSEVSDSDGEITDSDNGSSEGNIESDMSDSEIDDEHFAQPQTSSQIEERLAKDLETKLDIQFHDEDMSARKCHCSCKLWQGGSCLGQFTQEEQESIR